MTLREAVAEFYYAYKTTPSFEDTEKSDDVVITEMVNGIVNGLVDHQSLVNMYFAMTLNAEPEVFERRRKAFKTVYENVPVLMEHLNLDKDSICP